MTIILAQQVWPSGIPQTTDPLRVSGNPVSLTLQVTGLMAQADLDDVTLHLDISVQPSMDPAGNVWQFEPFAGTSWNGGPGAHGIQQSNPVWHWGMDRPLPRWLRLVVTPSRDLNLGMDGVLI